MNERRRYEFVLSVYFISRGFAFVVFEGPHSPVDWGIVEDRSHAKHARSLVSIMTLIERYRPDAIILEATDRDSTDRRPRIAALNANLRAYVEGYGLPLFEYGRDDVRRAFGHLPRPTKDAIAAEIGRNISTFLRYVPPPRRAWMSQDSRMALFDATALVIAYYLEHSRNA